MQAGEKGNLSEARILAAFVAAGYLVSVPFGSGHKYDFVVDNLACLYRVQCKTGRVKMVSFFSTLIVSQATGRLK